MRTLRIVVAGVLVAAGVVTVALTQASASTPTAPYDAITINASADALGLPAGDSMAFDDSNSSFQFTGGQAIETLAQSPTTHEYWSVDFWPPEGTLFAPGTYAVGHGGDSTHANVSISDSQAQPQQNFGCNSPTSGTVTVDELTKDAQSTINAFAAHYTVTCTAGSISGEVRWHSSLGYVAAKTSAGTDAYGEALLGVHSPAKVTTVTATGSKPIHLGTSAITGASAGIFSKTSDSCSGATLSYGQTCTVSVIATPTTSGAHTAALVIPDDAAGGQIGVALTATGLFDQANTYHAITPIRLLDTRLGLGGAKQALGPNSTLSVQVSNRFGILPGTATAAVLNVTVTGATASSFLTVYPTGVARPTASNLNFTKGFTGANSVTVKVGPDGKVNIYNQAGSTQVIVDLDGYYLNGRVYETNTTTPLWSGQFHPVSPEYRMLDTRQTKKQIPGLTKVMAYTSFGTSGNGHIGTFVVNVTALNATKPGFLTVWDGYGSVPTASTLNFTPKSTVSNLAVVLAGNCNNFNPACPSAPEITIYNASAAPVDVIVDIFGVFDDNTLAGGSKFRPITPTRIVDTRHGIGAKPLTAGATATSLVPSSLRDSATVGAMLNVTAVNPSASTFLTVWGLPDGAHRPTVSNLNPAAGQVLANGAVSAFSPGSSFFVYNYHGTTNFLVDVAGLFELDPYTYQPPVPVPDLAKTPAVTAPAAAQASGNLQPVQSGSFLR
jgi:hypothetical protein